MSRTNLDNMKNNGGLFISRAFPGNYPVFYIDAENDVTCADCANKSDYVFEIVHADINYEIPDLYCNNCNERIESTQD